MTVSELRDRLADFDQAAQVSVRVGDQFHLIEGANDVGAGNSVFLSTREKMHEERIARETAQGMAEDLAAMVATNAALLSSG